MKKISLSFIAVFVLLSFNVFAQESWMAMMQDRNANFKDVQAAFYKWYATHKPAAKEEDEDNVGKVGEEHEEDGNYMLFKRWEWLMHDRTYPTGKLPDQALIEKEYQDYLANQQTRKNTHKALATTPSWTYVGNTTIPSGGDAGRVNRVRFDPNNSSIVYACAPSGGLWKSTNGGTSWSTNTDQLLGISTSDIAIDPTNSKILYLATGDGDGINGAITTPSTIGVLKSTDGGLTWNPTGLHYTLQTSGPSLYTVNELKINPKNTQIIMAATSFGLWFTTNGGISWSEAQTGSFKSVEFEPNNPKVVYATTGSLTSAAAAYYRSTNGGQSFTAITLPTATSAGRMQLGVSPASPNVVYVLADNMTNDAFLGLWLSTDTGKTFVEKSTTPNLLGFGNGTGGDATDGQGWYTLSIAVSQTNAAEVLVGGVDIWESTNSGSSWTRITDWNGFGKPYVHADIHGITFAPSSGTTVYCGTDGGVSKSTSVSSTWTDVSSGLEIAEQYSIGLSGSNANEWITGWQDNGTNLNSGGWSEVIGGDGMICFIDQTNNNNMYGETYQGAFEMSSNGGASFNNITNGITETGPWATEWLQDPQAPNTLFAGLNNVWKSTNQGGNWTKISTYASTSTINAINVAPSNDQYIYAAQSGSIYATTNGGTNWNNVTGNLGLSLTAITKIAIDPNNPLRVWVTLSGYTATSKVFQSVTGGTTWTNISTNLPNLPVNCIAYAGGGIDAMYVGTDMGVYYRDTTNTAGEWVAYNTSLPNVIVSDLKIYAPSSLLRAATYGRGVWQIGLYQPAGNAPVAGFKAYPAKVCATNTVQFTDTSSNQPTSWNWTFGGGTPATSALQNPTITYSAAGTYSVALTATNANGNSSASQVNYVTVYPNPPTPVITQSDTLLTANPTTYPYYQWYRSGSIIGGATSFDYVESAKGGYKVVITDTNGCSSSVIFTVTVVNGIDELSSLSDYVSLYPNPTTGSVQLAFDIPVSGTYTVKLSNVIGQTMYTEAMHLSGKVTKTLDLSGYSKGVYFLSVEGNNSRAVRKVVLY